MKDDGRSTLPALLDLTLTGNTIASSFYCGEYERHAEKEVPTEDVVQGYQRAIIRAGLGDNSGTSDCQLMRDTILSRLPPDMPTLLNNLAQGVADNPLVNLEIRVHGHALERYPWELLAEPGLLAPPEAEVAVWRSAEQSPPDERPPSTAVLLIGSAALDSDPPFTHEEIGHLAQLLGQYPWINPLKHPSTTFGDFSKILAVIRPAVVHIAVHGGMKGFYFQTTKMLPKSHYTIKAQELAGCLARSATSVSVLDACDSATASPDSDPAARLISEKRGATTIGMAAELPACVGIPFAEDFYRMLAEGSTVIEAHSHAVRNIHDASDFANLWSVPVMYSSSPNLVIFPTSSHARARLSFDEVTGHLEKLGAELGAVADHRDWTSGDWAEHTAASTMRIRYVRRALATITRMLNERPDDLRYALRLGQGCADLKGYLADIGSCLDRLVYPSSSGHERARATEMMTDRLESIRQTMQRIGLLFVEMP